MNRFASSLSWLVFFAIVLLLPAPTDAQRDPLQGLDAYIQKSMAEWQVPGLAIAVVKDDRVVFLKGYGVREIGKAALVNEQTIFPLASVTKPFTAAAVALLVDEGKVSWDDPVIKHLPWLRLRDPWVTREATVRVLVAHRLGDERGPNAYIFETHACGVRVDEIVRRLHYLDPGPRRFRDRSTYGDVNYLLAGEVVAAVSGMSWAEFVKSRLLRPLGMTSAATSPLELWDAKDLRPCPTSNFPSHPVGIEDARSRNIAMEHVAGDHGPRATPWFFWNMGPAAAVSANIVDVAKWVRFQLGKGTLEGKRLLSTATLEETHRPQILWTGPPSRTLFPVGSQSGHFWANGLGWFLTDYRGRKLVMHWGYTSAFIALLPEENVGVAVLTNLDHIRNSLSEALAVRVFDAYVGAPERDWSAELLAKQKERGDPVTAREQEMARTRVSGTKPSLPLRSYAGTYSHPAFGEVTVTEESGALVLHFPPSTAGDLEHWHHDVFRVTWRIREPVPDWLNRRELLTFVLDLRGDVDALRIEEGVGVFKRVRTAP
jgi:CubicO group peptidase (beta-lactamase class C family)